MSFPGHIRQNNLKDWMRSFDREVTELYRDGSVEMAEKAERDGHLWPVKPAESIWSAAKRLGPLSELRTAGSCTESPIEDELATRLAEVATHPRYRDVALFVPVQRMTERACQADARARANARDGGFAFIYPQVKVANYRCDFLAVQLLSPRRVGSVAIECDGRYWHGGPKAQQRDRERDKFLQSRGIRVLRFSSKEILEDGDENARFILDVLCAPALMP